MSVHPPFRKIFEGVATRKQMFELFNRHSDASFDDRIDGKIYAGEWFEVGQVEYAFMLGVLPPLFMRTGMFGMSEYKTGYVTSVFLAISIRARERWFHGFCDLSDKRSPDALRAAIVAHETGAADGMTREEKLELIWSRASPDYKGIAGASNPDTWPAAHHGKRTILVFEPGTGTVLKLLQDLTGQEIENLLPAAFRKHGQQRRVASRFHRSPREKPGHAGLSRFSRLPPNRPSHQCCHEGEDDMSRLNEPENFAGRVAYAAKVIAYGRSPSRAFDNCFENHDGDEVATAILRRARRNARIAANLHRYLNLASAEAAALRLADIPTRRLAAAARETRAKKAAESKAWLAKHREKSAVGADALDSTAEGRA